MREIPKFHNGYVGAAQDSIPGASTQENSAITLA
jgi:hypothetical protein